jgi:hypothetical protein
MHNRVVDRAAPHAASALLAVRDWLLVALSFATGIYEAICFLTFGKVFTAAQTGNLVLLGIGVAGTRETAGPNPVTVVISLADRGGDLGRLGSPEAPRTKPGQGGQQRSSRPVDVTSVADVDDGDDMSLVVNPVDDAVGSAPCAEPVI